MFTCSVCDKPVVVRADGSILRTCEHADAPVAARLGASCTGKGALKQ